MMCAEQEEKLLPFIHPKATTKFLYPQACEKTNKQTPSCSYGVMMLLRVER